MNAETWASIGVSVATAGAGVWAARSARRTPRQEKRDDFVAITTQQGRAITRLERRVEKGEAKADKLQVRVDDLNDANVWLIGRLRDLVSLIRKNGHQLPPQRPMSEGAARVLPQRIEL